MRCWVTAALSTTNGMPRRPSRPGGGAAPDQPGSGQPQHRASRSVAVVDGGLTYRIRLRGLRPKCRSRRWPPGFGRSVRPRAGRTGIAGYVLGA